MGLQETIWFCATGKTGLGHLRRCATIARAFRRRFPRQPVGLLTNARVDGLEVCDHRAFAAIATVERAEMATYLAARGGGSVVVDTAVLPGLAKLERPLALILRETRDELIDRFRLESNRAWDVVIVPNPASHWVPRVGKDFARLVTPVGWIYRAPAPRQTNAGHAPRVLVASGGGGTADTGLAFKAEIDPIIRMARSMADRPFVVVQAIGPRGAACARLDEADATIDPGGELHREFGRSDVIISSAGYNSVLELALCDAPVLLVSVPRTIDDQGARARSWGPRLGAVHIPGKIEQSASRLASWIDAGTVRQPVDLGESGCGLAADSIAGLVS